MNGRGGRLSSASWFDASCGRETVVVAGPTPLGRRADAVVGADAGAIPGRGTSWRTRGSGRRQVLCDFAAARTCKSVADIGLVPAPRQMARPRCTAVPPQGSSAAWWFRRRAVRGARAGRFGRGIPSKTCKSFVSGGPFVGGHAPPGRREPFGVTACLRARLGSERLTRICACIPDGLSRSGGRRLFPMAPGTARSLRWAAATSARSARSALARPRRDPFNFRLTCNTVASKIQRFGGAAAEKTKGPRAVP